MTRRFLYLIFALFAMSDCATSQAQSARTEQGQSASELFRSVSPARMRVIIDNDFSGDPDGLFQLAHHLLSPSVNIVGIIGGHEDAVSEEKYKKQGTTSADVAVEKTKHLMKLLGQEGRCPVVVGAKTAMTSPARAIDSEGAQLIIREAMRTDTNQPLFVACGGGLTNIASALLMKPEIASRLTVIWIGGPEYPDLSPLYSGFTSLEPNQNIDPASVRCLFNDTKASLIQIPRNMYRRCLYPVSLAIRDIRPLGTLGKYLTDEMTGMMNIWNSESPSIGETYILGDSPLVLLTALCISVYPDGCILVDHHAPKFLDDDSMAANPDGRIIKVCTWINTALLYADMKCKFQMWAEK